MCAEPHALTRAHKYTHTKKTEKCLNVIAHAYIKIPVKKTKKNKAVCACLQIHINTYGTQQTQRHSCPHRKASMRIHKRPETPPQS